MWGGRAFGRQYVRGSPCGLPVLDTGHSPCSDCLNIVGGMSGKNTVLPGLRFAREMVAPGLNSGDDGRSSSSTEQVAKIVRNHRDLMFRFGYI